MNNNGFGTVSAYLAGTAAINATAAISKKHDPTPVLFASAALYVLLIVIGLFTRWEWVKPFAGIIFLISVLANAMPLVANVIKLVNGLQLQSAKNAQTNAQSKAPSR